MVESSSTATRQHVCNRFHHRTAERAATTRHDAHAIAAQACTGEIVIDDVELFSGGGEQPVTDVPMDQGLRIRISLRATSDVRGLSLDVGIHTADFVFVTRTSTSMLSIRPDFPAGAHVIECAVDRIALNPDSYGLGITIRDRYDRIVWQGANVRAFSVVPGAVERERMPVHAALLYLPFTWSIPSLHLSNLKCDLIADHARMRRSTASSHPRALPSARIRPIAKGIESTFLTSRGDVDPPAHQHSMEFNAVSGRDSIFATVNKLTFSDSCPDGSKSCEREGATFCGVGLPRAPARSVHGVVDANRDHRRQRNGRTWGHRARHRAGS